jgi:hypothetical protein
VPQIPAARGVKPGQLSRSTDNEHHKFLLFGIHLPLTASSDIPPNITPESNSTEIMKRQVSPEVRVCRRWSPSVLWFSAMSPKPTGRG